MGGRDDDGLGCGCTALLIFWGIGLPIAAFLILKYRYDWFSLPAGIQADTGGRYVQQLLVLLKISGAVYGALLCSSIGGQLFLSRWRRPAVFISYQHENEPVAAQIASSLTAQGIKSEYKPYLPDEHDAVLQDVLGMLRACDAMVTIPGASRSFVDAEIFAASAQQKPIIFIKRSEGGTLPDTAFTGYPVFKLEIASMGGFVALSRFIKFACNHWSDALRSNVRIARAMWQALVYVGIGLFALAFLVDMGKTILLLFMSIDSVLSLELAWQTIQMASFGVIAVVAMAAVVWHKIKAIQVCRQKILSGNLTYSILQDALGGLEKERAIIERIDKTPLEFRHGTPARQAP